MTTKKRTFSTDDECPYCGAVLYKPLVDRVFDGSGPSTEFDYECPNCDKTFHVEVVPVPSFTITKAQEAGHENSIHLSDSRGS